MINSSTCFSSGRYFNTEENFFPKPTSPVAESKKIILINNNINDLVKYESNSNQSDINLDEITEDLLQIKKEFDNNPIKLNYLKEDNEFNTPLKVNNYEVKTNNLNSIINTIKYKEIINTIVPEEIESDEGDLCDPKKLIEALKDQGFVTVYERETNSKEKNLKHNENKSPENNKTDNTLMNTLTIKIVEQVEQPNDSDHKFIKNVDEFAKIDSNKKKDENIIKDISIIESDEHLSELSNFLKEAGMINSINNNALNENKLVCKPSLRRTLDLTDSNIISKNYFFEIASRQNSITPQSLKVGNNL